VEDTLDSFLAQCGKPTVEAFRTGFPHPFLFREVTVGERLEARLTRVVRRDKGWPVAIGSASPAHVFLGERGTPAVACEVAPAVSGGHFTITIKAEDISYDGERLAPGAVVRLEEGRVLELGPETAVRTFSSTGLVHFLAFRSALEAVKRGG